MAIKAAWGLSDVPIVGTVTVLTPVKGVSHLIEAARMVCKRHPRALFVIVGDGPLRPSLERMVHELGLMGRVVFWGLRRDVREVLSIMDVFVLPSISEGMGLSLMEAMAMERPVVASRVGGVPELVMEGDSGVLVPPADPVQLAEGILWCLEERRRATEMGRRARQRVQQLFSVERMVKETDGVYQCLVRRKGRDVVWHP
jgi:glycosyltransferase involved in cell wall biosynthesis